MDDCLSVEEGTLLKEVFSRLSTTHKCSSNQTTTASKLPKYNGGMIPYLGFYENPTFVMEESYESSLALSFKCDPCVLSNIPIKVARVHAAYHIVHTNDVSDKGEVCGFCLSYNSGADNTLCRIGFDKNNQMVSQVLNGKSCPIFSKVSRAPIVKAAKPKCTNYIVYCSQCQTNNPKDKTAIWSYYFRDHWNRHHSPLPLPGYDIPIEISNAEKVYVKDTWLKLKKNLSN